MIAGPSGTGKSHLVEALAHAAIEKDLRVAWFTLETLTAAIGRAKADGSIARTVTRICRSDLIVVDDIGMLPAGQDAAEAFYRITDAAYERRSVAVTSNIHPSGFDSIMPKTLATATVDRLLHHAHLVITKGDSHRLAEALAGKGVIPLAIRAACQSLFESPAPPIDGCPVGAGLVAQVVTIAHERVHRAHGVPLQTREQHE